MTTPVKFRLVLLAFVLLAAAPAWAQPYKTMHAGMNNWYFGNTPKALNFNRITKTPTTVTKFNPFGNGGGATASNPLNGNLLFYTDGQNVYDATNQLMINGSGLFGNPTSNQSAVICPVPGQVNKFFIFTNSATNTSAGSIRYEVVDMNQLGNAAFPSVVPLGDLEAPLHNTLLALSNQDEAMIIMPHSNGTDFWLITHVRNSNTYQATLINAASYTPAHTGIFTTTNTTGPGLIMNASHFAAFGNNIAVAPTSSSIDAIILIFIEGTASFNLFRTITNSASAATNNQAIYDIEWSGDGRYVYYSMHGDTGVPGNIFQYDFTNPAITLAPVLPAPVFRSFGLQMAPDSTIYHIYQNGAGQPFLLGRIADPDSVAALANYQTLPIDGTTWAATQFPAVLPLTNPTITVAVTTAGNCQNSATSFYPTVTPAADSLIWDFGDGTPPVNSWSPVHTYQNPGPVSATVTAFFQGRPQLPPTSVALNITPFALQLQLVSDTTACTFEFPPPKGTTTIVQDQFSVTATVSGGTPPSAFWSNGDTGLTLRPDSAGYFYLTISDGTCSTYAGVTVREYNVPDQRSNVWYFGNEAGIDFNQSPPVALTDGAMNAPEGCSAMSDRNGEIIFYTDGNNVYDQDHTLIATGIGGNTSASQSALIVPVPGDETLYYIFTTEANSDYPTNTVYYSLFDLKENLGKGDIVQQRIPLYNGSTERLTSNGRWLITHEFGNNSFRCYEISINGIGQPVITSIGSAHNNQSPTQAEGYMKISPSSVVAVPLNFPSIRNVIEVFDFVDSTGLLTNFRSVDLQESTAQVYGIEFQGNKMFATLTGSPSFIRETYFDFQNNPVLIPPGAATISGPFAEELGALQIAPDGQIYMAINGSPNLGVFTVNPDTLQLSTVNLAGFNLAGKTSNLGLPSFVQFEGSGFGGPGMSIAGVCFGTPMDYVAIPTDPIDTFLWGFGDGANSTLETGQHSYAAPGTYTVTLQINNRCLIHDGLAPYDFTEDITIVAPPAVPALLPTAAICTNPIQLTARAAAVVGESYLWSTGATTPQITVSALGTYGVTITDDVNGCTSTGTTNLIDGRPPVDLGPDITTCEGGFVSPLPAPAGNGFTRVWTVDGVANGNTTNSQSVVTTTPGVDVYQVTVTNNATLCQVVDDVTITINEAPNFSLSAVNTGACAAANGQINVNITPLLATTQPPVHTFSYFLTGPSTASVSQLPVGVYAINGLPAGSYFLLVQDDISNCTLSLPTSISDPANTLVAPDITTCNTVAITATTNANTVPIAGNFNYDVFDATNTIVDSGVGNTAVFNTNVLPPGTYTLQITKGVCITTDAVTVTQNTQVNLTTTSDVCLLPNASVTAATTDAGVSFVWSGGPIVSGTNNPTAFVNPPFGIPTTYSVTASNGVLCDNTVPVTITLETPIIPTIDATDPCQDQVILSADPASSGFSYQWYRNGAIDVSLLGQQISLTTADDGDQFIVEIISGFSGCLYQSTPAITAAVTGLVTAGISSTPACDDGSEFVITATTTASSPTFTWSRDIGAGYIVIAGETAATTSQGIAANYKITVTQATCSSEAEITLIKSPLPVGALPDRVVICDDPENNDPTTATYDLDPGVFASYQWFYKQTFDSPELNLNSTDQVYTADRQGFYYRVELTNFFGCTASDFTEVVNDCVPLLVAPNAFRPASSVGDNRVFKVKSFFITDEDFKVFIYNRWGELVYQSDERGFEWNGGRENNSGVPLPSGAYAYVIQYVSSFRPDEGVQEKRGGVMLLR